MNLPDSYSAALAALRAALVARSPQTAHLAFRLLELHSPQLALHSLRVASLTQEIADVAGYREARVPLRLGALLHDLGKIALPAELLEAARPLTSAEVDLVRRHPISGLVLLLGDGHEPLPSTALIDPIAHHHERWDGTGYPCGLAGNRIPLSSRIVALADLLEVLQRPRPYHADPRPSPRTELCAAAGTQLDPDLTALALRHLLPED